MVLELYIFNKQDPLEPGFSRWLHDEKQQLRLELVFSSNKFKIRKTAALNLDSFMDQLNFIYRTNQHLEKFFENYHTNSFEFNYCEDFHHICLYNPNSGSLYLDSEAQEELIPLYLFGFYYHFARNDKYSEDDILENLPSFINSFEDQSIEKLIRFLIKDSQSKQIYDAGGHLKEYLIKCLELREQQDNGQKLYKETQLLRNRALVGTLPYQVQKFQSITDFYDNSPGGSFSGEAITAYYDELKQNLEQQKEFLKPYYKHLCLSLKAIGLGIVAQRGSRVAHEQGPLLVNSTVVKINEELELEIKKYRSAVVSALGETEALFDRIKENFSNLKSKTVKASQTRNIEQKAFGLIAEILTLTREEKIQIEILIDEIMSLSSSPEAALARYQKNILETKDILTALFEKIKNKIPELKLKKTRFLNLLEDLHLEEKASTAAFYSLQELLNSTPQERKKAVIYVQRPSSRSGHFIPRILLGENLYIENDLESEEHRLRSIPYNFVSPEFELIADEIDSFFENASISIVTDRLTGDPSIKWENAEDLAISLAPGFYQAMQAHKTQGSLFHYQLETTLFGPLIDLFQSILEFEISNIASLAEAPNSQELLQEVQNTCKEYQKDITEAADFCFSYYLLQENLEEHILREGVSRQEAITELILTMRDVQNDIAHYCLLKKHKTEEFTHFITQAKSKLAENTSSKDKALHISKLLQEKSTATRQELNSFVKKYIRYPESTARKETLAKNKNIQIVTVSGDKTKQDCNYYYHFTVAPSRIDFGKHVVASITSLMGRMLGADDLESLKIGKEYIDLVSITQNSFFESASEAGSTKVIENTCRALQYSKAISFQGAFQCFDIDGNLARQTINSRNTKEAGIHIMEQGTMASTGYCITKEPLFILLALAMDSDSLLTKAGIEDATTRQALKELMQEISQSKESFSNILDWEVYAYQTLSDSELIKQNLSSQETPWLPNLQSLAALFKHLGDSGSYETQVQKAYANIASKLIEHARFINETGIIQRIQVMNQAIRVARQAQNKDPQAKYDNLNIALNAAYKGNVSDERENANQYLLALLLNEKQYLKNVSNPDISELLEIQNRKHGCPAEIRIFDPLVDPDIFMNGELKHRAESCVQKTIQISEQFITPLKEETIIAAIASYGSDLNKWRILEKRYKELYDLQIEAKIRSELDGLQSDLKLLELYAKGFYKNPYLGYQAVDVIQLNADHDEIKDLVADLVMLRTTMQRGKEDSLLVLVDNPQQAKKPLLDYDSSREWLALGGTLASHMISQNKYQKWKQEIERERDWAKGFINLALKEEQGLAEAQDPIKQEIVRVFADLQKFADIKKELLKQKFQEAKELEVKNKTLERYKESIECYSRIEQYQDYRELDFADWLALGGRWVLNGEDKDNIDYVLSIFDKSNKLNNINKRSHDILDLFVSARKPLPLKQQKRIIQQSGSTKEADLLVTSASDSLEFREQEAKTSKSISQRFRSHREHKIKLAALDEELNFQEIESRWNKVCYRIEKNYPTRNKSEESKAAISSDFGELLALLEYSCLKLINKDAIEDQEALNLFLNQKYADHYCMEQVFGNHKDHGGLFQRLANQLKLRELISEYDFLAKLGEMFNYCFLLLLTINIKQANEVINELSVFFDQYLNVHEEDYPPYMFHRLCAGDSYGFNNEYYLNDKLREKMFKLSCETGHRIYKILHYLISEESVLKEADQDYKDCLIGDYESGLIPLLYQHETICLEERFWDCMRALRNFVRNYHDKHPLPIIIKGENACVDKLFRYQVDDNVDLVWIAGLTSPGKHSWDLNSVFRAARIKEEIQIDATGNQFAIVNAITPYLQKDGSIKQIYTAISKRVIEEQGIQYIAPYKGRSDFDCNQEDAVHAIIVLNEEEASPRANLTMSAHTHPQYISGLSQKLQIPELWSYLNMRQMYAKTELPNILKYANLSGLAQVEFYENEFASIEDVEQTLRQRVEEKSYSHIDRWILKASKDSGGRGISDEVSLHNDFDAIVDFIWLKTRTDDVVMQEFVPNNARVFASPEFLSKIGDEFIEAGLKLENTSPFEQMFFATRAFQSMSGIKGYLFSVNIGTATVNAGQGAKMFYGEPFRIMPLYLAGKIQKLMDEYGEILLKQAIPQHAVEFGQKNSIEVVQNNNYNNCLMLNGLFDYIPYIYVNRDSLKFKVFCEDNSSGGIDFYYHYYGEKIDLCSAEDHAGSILAIENYIRESEGVAGVDLAIVELNSGLGQANLLQRTIEEMAPENKDLFLEWTYDLGHVARSYQLKKTS